MITELCATVLCTALAILILLRLRAYRLRDKLGLKGPKINPLLGNALLFLDPTVKWDVNQKLLFDRLKKAYGNVYGLYLGPQLNVVVTDLDLAREILIKNFSCFTDRSHIAILNNKPMSDCLFNLQKERWKEVRCTVVQAFKNRIMKQMATASLPKIHHFIRNLEPFVENNEGFDIYKHFQILTVNVIAQCAFALDLDASEEQNHRFLTNCRQLFDGYDFNESWLIRLSLLFPELNLLLKPFVRFTKFRKAETALVNDLRLVLEQKRKAHLNNSVDILQLLMENNCPTNQRQEQRGTQLSDDAIIANALVFLLAGYETSSTAMGFCAWLLAKHQQVQQRLYKEVTDSFQSKEDEYEMIQTMPYLDAVFRETLRLYPPLVLLVVRTCVQHCTINSIPFEPGVQILFPSYSIQRDEDVWPMADSFMPERFLEHKEEHQQHPLAWLPFGAGPRNCIGKRFAEMQFKITVAHLINRYRLSLSQNSQDPIETKSNGATIKPSQGVIIKIDKRHNH